MKPIHEILGYTEHDYDMVVFQNMLNWADLYCNRSPQRAQILLANRLINNWFRLEFAKLLEQFRADLVPFENKPGVTYKDYRGLFVRTVSKIYDIYPSALLTEVKDTLRQSPKYNHN